MIAEWENLGDGACPPVHGTSDISKVYFGLTFFFQAAFLIDMNCLL